MGAGQSGAGSNPAPDTKVIRIEGLVKQYGKVTALDGVDFEVPAGELLVLVGLSGSGKSTLLRHINGLTQPTKGRVEVLGTRVDEVEGLELRRLRRRIGFIFQQFHLVERITVIENVLHGSLGRIRYPRFGVLAYPRHLRREALDHLDRVGLADRAFQRADTLSGGQQQRVAIARSLMQGPEVLLADEPVASLDPETSANVMDLLFRICMEDALTVVCSLHQVELALGYAHRLIGLRDGRVVLDSPARSITHDDVLEVYTTLEPGRAGAKRLGSVPTEMPSTAI